MANKINNYLRSVDLGITKENLTEKQILFLTSMVNAINLMTSNPNVAALENLLSHLLTIDNVPVLGINSLRSTIPLLKGQEEISDNYRFTTFADNLMKFKAEGYHLGLCTEGAFKPYMLKIRVTPEHIYSRWKAAEFIIDHVKKNGPIDIDWVIKNVFPLIATVYSTKKENTELDNIVKKHGLVIEDLLDMKHYKLAGIRLIELPIHHPLNKKKGKGKTFYKNLITESVKGLIIRNSVLV